MSRRKHEIIRRALQRLSIIGAGETPNADDGALAAEVWTAVRQELVNVGVMITSDDDIPADLFEGAADLLAYRLAPDFGLQKAASEEAAALRKIFRMSGNRYEGEPVEAKYF